MIAAAAVCDYKPLNRVAGKISKTGGPITLEMIETDDVLAELGRHKDGRWVLGFALEATNARENALQKLRAKTATGLSSTGPRRSERKATASKSSTARAASATHFSGTKAEVARHLIGWIQANVHSS